MCKNYNFFSHLRRWNIHLRQFLQKHPYPKEMLLGRWPVFVVRDGDRGHILKFFLQWNLFACK